MRSRYLEVPHQGLGRTGLGLVAGEGTGDGGVLVIGPDLRDIQDGARRPALEGLSAARKAALVRVKGDGVHVPARILEDEVQISRRDEGREGSICGGFSHAADRVQLGDEVPRVPVGLGSRGGLDSLIGGHKLAVGGGGHGEGAHEGNQGKTATHGVGGGLVAVVCVVMCGVGWACAGVGGGWGVEAKNGPPEAAIKENARPTLTRLDSTTRGGWVGLWVGAVGVWWLEGGAGECGGPGDGVWLFPRERFSQHPSRGLDTWTRGHPWGAVAGGMGDRGGACGQDGKAWGGRKRKRSKQTQGGREHTKPHTPHFSLFFHSFFLFLFRTTWGNSNFGAPRG